MKMRPFSLNALCILSLASFAFARGRNSRHSQANLKSHQRGGKALSIFQIITFPNDPCIGGSKNGTCYTEAECNGRGGNNAGTCAAGFGVCCTITLSCGGESNENCTYFDSEGITAGGCSAKICPCSSDICQMRLDFNSFQIAGPSMNTNTVTKVLEKAGVIVESASKSITDQSQCLTDSFSVTNGGGINPPTICGTNNGQHMYIDVCHNQCTKLSFSFGSTAYFTNIPTRSFTIKVTQYSCQYPNLAPQGCTQYFFDNPTGNIQTFNYNNGNGQHLAQQDQSFCVRRERGNCRICWYAINPTDFVTSGTTTGMTKIGFNKGKLCGSYFSSSSKGFDFINIPGAEKATGDGGMIGSNICGGNVGLVTLAQTTMTTMSKSICSNKTPFVLHFRSDAFEMPNEAKIVDRGFMLGYTQDSINCP